MFALTCSHLGCRRGQIVEANRRQHAPQCRQGCGEWSLGGFSVYRRQVSAEKGSNKIGYCKTYDVYYKNDRAKKKGPGQSPLLDRQRCKKGDRPGPEILIRLTLSTRRAKNDQTGSPLSLVPLRGSTIFPNDPNSMPLNQGRTERVKSY